VRLEKREIGSITLNSLEKPMRWIWACIWFCSDRRYTRKSYRPESGTPGFYNSTSHIPLDEA
jgi:hypothetical protein